MATSEMSDCSTLAMQRSSCPSDVCSVTGSTAGSMPPKYSQPEDPDFDSSTLQPIPRPPARAYMGLLGHAPDLEPGLPVRTYWKLMDEYPPIYQLDLNMPHPRVFVGSRELVNEMADDSRFVKFTHRLHQQMRPVFGDGLFSAESTDPAWWKAHRLLVPAFGSVGLSKMFEDMQDISAQLVQKWDRHGHETEIDCIEDMARLTFDTIGLCAFGYRFNGFYMKEAHPFMQQLWESIVESGKRANRPDLLNLAYYKDEARRQQNILKMQTLCRKIIQDRLEHPQPESRDLLNIMLHGVDKVSNETLGVENVINQIPTLLGGGYETTGSTLCFIYYYLCKNPDMMRKARYEVDEVVGKQVLTYDMLRQLKYLDAVMKEALRMQHPVSLFTRFAIKDTVIGGKYLIKKGQMLSGIWRHFHRDPDVWGEDADEFRPERMLDTNFSKMPPNAWKPFGDGLRACIGRGFAEQEILIHVAMALQKFEVSLVDPRYDLQLKGQMGLKPVGFKIRVKRRHDRSLYDGIPGGLSIGTATPSPDDTHHQRLKGPSTSASEDLKPVNILYGGNMGTCESLADAFAHKAPGLGLKVVSKKELDEVVGKLSEDSPSLIIIPSYEGRPPDNARRFVAWIDKLTSSNATLSANTAFAVFGVGNSDWVHTFHKVPTLLDAQLAQLGASRILPAGFANVKRDLHGAWESWSDQICVTLSGQVASNGTASEKVGVEVEIDVHDIDRMQDSPGAVDNIGTVTVNRELAAKMPNGFAKRHMEIRLPKGCEYRAGDYMVIHPDNAEHVVQRVMARFSLDTAAAMRVRESKKKFLPHQSMAVQQFLRSNVDLTGPVTPLQLSTLLAWCQAAGDKQRIQQMQASHERLIDQRASLLDVLDDCPELELPFGVFVDLLLPLAPRLYSIASSPEEPKNRTSEHDFIASLTFDVFESPAKNGRGAFRGVASTYLANRAVGETVNCHVRPSRVQFQLPADPSTPVVMLAAGSGIAPMRALLQERAALCKRGARLGPALLFYGCRNPERDYLYHGELDLWCRKGIVHVVPCFSCPDGTEAKRYVGDALWERRERVWRLFEQGARVYVCGSAARLGQSVASTWMKIWSEFAGGAAAEAQEWLHNAKRVGGQYVSDVY